ncbi:MAG: N-acyl-D-glutamate deacylase [Raineya sp.]
MKISRRKAIKNIAIGSATLLVSPSCIAENEKQNQNKRMENAFSGIKITENPQAQSQYKIVIKNGSFFVDNQLKKNIFLGVTQEGKIKISESPLQGLQEIDASDKIVSPGFIDILADNASNPQQTYSIFEKYKVSDGLSTVLQMHGGAEFPKKFHDYFDKQPHRVNYGVSVFVMRLRLMYASLAKRYELAEQGLKDGALAMAHSPEYQPDTTYTELKEYAKIAKKYERPYFLHLRYSSQEKELEGVKEAIRLAEETGVQIHIDHLNSTGGTFNMPKALELIQNANAKGAKITCCVYPYSFWATYLISERFGGDWQKRYGITYEDLEIVGTGERITAQTYPIYRKRAGLLVAVPPGTMPFEKTINLALQTDFCMFGSDGGIEREPRANSHPRGAGFAATAIRHCLNIGMSIEQALERLVLRPAKLLQPVLSNRAALKDGNWADITIFDPQTINGKATVANPNQFSQGIDCVIVNGEIAYHNGKLLKSNGRPIKYPI